MNSTFNMASGEESWAQQTFSAPAAHDNPHAQPSIPEDALSASVLLDPEMQPYQLSSSYPSPWPPQHVNPNQLSRNAGLQDASEPIWNPHLLNPAPPVTWPDRQHSLPALQGTALTNTDQRVGIAPQDRKRLGQAEVPSLVDQDRVRELDEELAKVRSWLEDSQLSSDHLSPTAHVDRRGRAHSSPAPQPLFVEPSTGTAQPVDDIVALDTQLLSIPGPGAMLQVPEDNDEDTFGLGDDQISLGESTTPPALPEPSSIERDLVTPDDVATNEPSMGLHEFLEPWTDDADQIDSAHVKEQPQSSNAAMAVFMRKARDLETASLTATLGSRRRSEADLKSLASQQGANASGPAEAPQSNLFRRYFPSRRHNGNAKKRKEGDERSIGPVSNLAPVRKESQGGLSPLKRVISRPRTPRLDSGPEHQPNLNSTIGTRARKTLSRMRSRSDLGNTGGQSALAEQWARQGGPPVPSLRSQETDAIPVREQESAYPQGLQSTSPDDGEGDDEGIQDAASSMPLQVGEAPTAADKDAFKSHIKKLNPRIAPYMLSRLTIEQDKRFHRLVESRTKHEVAVKTARCQTGDFCNDLGKGPKYPSAPTGRGADSGAPIFWVTSPKAIEEYTDHGEKAHFPAGIPIPPVSRLPAEFECPLCFQVKKILKPSDWTKHVNEDIQPFTCTFPDCSEAKSFKRKADWVRHESERHRHLEAWQCDLDGCQHRCYRRDNFVQHLVREHRLPEPSKIHRAAYAPGSEPGDIVPYHVERCREESTRQATDEPCRFCGNLCMSWKKLSVHLAQHMQQISIPTLKLVGVVTSTTEPLQVAVGAGASHSKPPHTPTTTSPGSRTPSVSNPGSSRYSNAQSSTSSGENWDPLTTPLVSVTDTSKPPPAAAPPSLRQGPHSRAPSLGARPQQPQLSGKQLSTYPVKGPPGLGLSWQDPSKQQQQPVQSQMFGNQPQTPLTPGYPEINTGLGVTPHSQATFGGVWPTYPPPGRTSASARTSQATPLELHGLFSEQQISDSPIEATAPDFSTMGKYPTMGAEDNFASSMKSQEGDEAEYYDMQQAWQYTMAEQDDNFAQSRTAFIPPGGEENEAQQYHSATYPPQFYHPGPS